MLIARTLELLEKIQILRLWKLDSSDLSKWQVVVAVIKETSKLHSYAIKKEPYFQFLKVRLFIKY